MLKTLRSLARTPAFALSTVLTIALGVGANTGAFSALHTLLLQPLPYPQPDRLVTLYETTLDRQPRNVSLANLLDWQRRSTLFESMAAFRSRSFGLTFGDRDAVTVIQTGMVTAGFFPTLGASPSIGRIFTEPEEASDARLLLLTDRLWRARFAANPAIAGRTVFLNEEPFTVLGVLPPGFEYPMGQVLPDAFLPLSRRDYCCSRSGSLSAIGRLRSGVTFERARAELASISAQLAAEYPETNGHRSAALRPLAETQTGARRQPLLLLTAAAALLLAIAFANTAGLFIARASARSHEIAVRASLGAGRWQLLRPFLWEAAVLSLAGGSAGLLAAHAVLRLIPRFIPTADGTPLSLDRSAFAFSLALVVLLTFALGCAPLAVFRRRELARLIHAGGRAATSPRTGFRSALVVAQVALSVVLLLSAGALLRSFLHVLAASPGFETAHALTFGIGLPEKRYDSDLKLLDFHRRLLDRLAAIPGVSASGAAMRLPLRGPSATSGSAFQLAGEPLPPAERPRTAINAASPGYFGAMSIPILAGRDFSWQLDRPAQHRAAIVNQSFERAFLAGRRSLGTALALRWVSELDPPGSTWEIVGVAADTRQANLDRDPVPEIFLSFTQLGADGASYVVRTRAADPALSAAIAAAVATLDPRIQHVSVATLSQLVESNLGNRTAAVELVGAFAALALLLTAVGLYGIVAFRAAARSREMAIRMALGATPTGVRRLVLADAARLALAGAAAGIAGFYFVAPLLASQLYGVGSFDPPSAAAVAALVAVVAVLAAAIPGHRAARRTPLALLRES